MDSYKFIVEAEDEKLRIDKFLSEQLPDLSRSRIQKLLKEEHVLVNKKPAKASYVVQELDEISMNLPPNQKLDIEPEDIPLNILYEDSDLLVVNKPKNMVVHPAAGHYTGTLVNALLFHCKDQLSGINGVLRPGIVHRIDKDTTGALVVCKNDHSHQVIARQLAVHSITRKYCCIVHGIVKEEEGTIEGNIGRHPVDRKKMAVVQQGGKTAVTHYRVLKQFDQFTYMECELDTGRTHQIRVHMASIGHPVLGDELYGPKKCPIKGLSGQTLHARVIGFIHPSSGEYIECTAPLPEYFEDLLNKIK